MQTGTTSGPRDVTLELIDSSWEVGIQVMIELCHTVLDGFGISAK